MMEILHHHRNDSMMGVAGLIIAMVGLLIFAAILYELVMNRTWIAQHIPSEVKQALPEQVTKAIENV